MKGFEDMFKRYIVTSSLTMLALTSVFCNNVVIAEENNSTTEELEPMHRTAMHPIKAQELIDAGYVETYRGILHSAGVSDEMLNKVSLETLKKAAFNYLITVGNETVNPEEAGQCLLYLVPDLLDTSIPENNTSSENPIKQENTHQNSKLSMPMSNEEAIAYTNNGFYNTYMNSLKTYGITDDMLAKLPKDAVFNAAINYLTTRDLLGDIKMPFRHFTNLYPEVLSKTSDQKTSLSEEDRKKNSQKSLKKQQQISTHIQNNLKNQQEDLENLPKDFTFNTDSGEYKIKYLATLAPGEAGNQSQDKYMLVIKYQFNNSSDQSTTTYTNEFEDHVQVSQNINGSPTILDTAVYQLENQEYAHEIEEIAPGQSIMATAYYQLENLDSPAIASILIDNEVSDYDLDLNSLIKFPLQSAIYQDESEHGYIFDFNTIYLLYPQSEQITNWENNVNVEINNLDSFELSPEATLQANKLETPATAVCLKNITYILGENNKIKVTDDAGNVLLTIQSDDEWQSFYDDKGNIFNIVK
ncbi:DUF5067 domain-containing protein [Facklamia hominis]|nr:DUF5067 domain-containing protein [Facklamia hominis]